MAVAAQVLGCALLCLAVGAGLGLWWGVGLAGLMLLVGGVIAESVAEARRAGHPLGRGVSEGF